MKSRYDVVIVGAGPAGSWTAKHAAQAGVSVLLLEKDRDIGIPVRCAEGVSAEGLEKEVEIKDQWIARKIVSTYLVAPNGVSVPLDIKNVGYILHRRFFDHDLADMAAQAGAEVVTKAYVSGLILEGNQPAGVIVNHMGEIKKINASIVVGADGVETRVGRWAGVKTQVHPDEIASCAQMTLAGIELDPDAIGMYFGGDIAPGGYCWVFPKGVGSANVGLGIPAKHARIKRPIAYLQDFIEERYPGAAILSTVAGGVPLTRPLKQISGSGFMLVGDAAHQVNSMTGGGIVYAMQAGAIAGRIAADAVRAGNVSASKLRAYDKAWASTGGKKLEKYYRIKQVITGFSDEDLNEIADHILSVDEKKRSLFELFKRALIKHPKLVLEAAKLFVS